MKYTRILFTAILTLMITSVTLFAQEEIPDKYKKRAEMRMEKISEKLDLSEEQKGSFFEIHKKYKEQAKTIKGETQSRDQLRELMYNNKKAHAAEIKSILTPEQYAIYDKIDDKGKGRKGKHGKRGKRM